MKTKIERQRHELEEKIGLLENNKYPKPLERVMMKDVLGILTDYSGKDFPKQMNRYLVLNGEDKINKREDCFGLWKKKLKTN